MKLSAGLGNDTHKKTLYFLCEKIPFIFFSLTIAAMLTIRAVHAEDAVENTLTNGSAANVAETSVSTMVPSTAPPLANINTLNASKSTLAEPKKISSASQLANLVGGLILILGLIYGLSWFVKRFSQGGFMQNSTIKMLSAMPLGTRERIMLVDVGGKQILLGITATSINALHVFEQQVVNPDEGVTPTASDFSQKLMTLLQKNMMSQKNTAQQKDLSNSTFSNQKNTKN